MQCIDPKKGNKLLTNVVTEKQNYKKDRAWIEINLNNLIHNANVLKNVMPKNCELMAVVKTNAYGHGDKEIAACLNQNGIDTFAAATVKEAIRLRKNGIRGDILILGHTDLDLIPEVLEYNLIQTITSYEYGKRLNQGRYNQKIKTHIKIDTGMHRLGLEAEAADKVIELFFMSNLEICGIFTHLCVSDSQQSTDISFTKLQISRFYELLDKIKDTGLNLPKIHIQSSYGLLNYPQLTCDYARIGIALYGTFSTLEDTLKNQWNLHPVLELKAKVAVTRAIKAGESVSYGRLFISSGDMKIAVIAIGYGDGYPRHISLRGGHVLLHGKRVPILGRICMDQLVVDISEIPKVKAGDIATLIGKDGEEEILAAEVAEKAESITNELLCRLGERLERVYIIDEC